MEGLGSEAHLRGVISTRLGESDFRMMGELASGWRGLGLEHNGVDEGIRVGVKLRQVWNERGQVSTLAG